MTPRGLQQKLEELRKEVSRQVDRDLRKCPVWVGLERGSGKWKSLEVHFFIMADLVDQFVKSHPDCK